MYRLAVRQRVPVLFVSVRGVHDADAVLRRGRVPPKVVVVRQVGQVPPRQRLPHGGRGGGLRDARRVPVRVAVDVGPVVLCMSGRAARRGA